MPTAVPSPLGPRSADRLASSSGRDRPVRSDYALLAAYALLLFGIALWGGRVLTVHEARLPQASREMLADGDWLVPKNGGRPWLERPPMPHWLTVSALATFGDGEWVVRLPNVLAGLATVLLTARVGGLLFGRATGLLAGFALATSFQFLRYAWLAEEDIYLAAIVTTAVAWFAELEFGIWADADAGRANWFFTNRSAPVWGLFLLLGASNFVKGLCFAALLFTAAAGGWLLTARGPKVWFRYIWLGGWLLFAGLAAAWPWAAGTNHPDLYRVMFGDVQDRLANAGDPVWYYLPCLLWNMLPWTPLVLVGLYATAGAAWKNRESAERFVWCWAWLPVLVLSIPAWKHHHYLVPILPAWALLAARGFAPAWAAIGNAPHWCRHPVATGTILAIAASVVTAIFGQRYPDGRIALGLLVPGLAVFGYLLHASMLARSPRPALGVLFGGVLLLAWGSHVFVGRHIDTYRAETDFLADVRAKAAPDEAVYCLAPFEPLETFRILFYLRDRGRMLHNHTYLLDEKLTSRTILLLARGTDAGLLRQYGTPERLLQSPRRYKGQSPEYSWTLYRLTFRPDLVRVPADQYVSPLQTCCLADGPYLVPPGGPEPLRTAVHGSGRMQR